VKHIFLICAVVSLVGCGGKKDDGNTGVVNPNKPSPKAVPVNIADPIVEKAIRKELKKRAIQGELTKADLEKVTRLDLFDNQLTEVPKGLEKLTQLTELELGGNQLTDVKGLEKLTKLTFLNLQSNQLTDVKGLEKLTKLTWLRLDYNKLTDVKGLEKLTQLKELWLDSDQLTEVPKEVEKLTQLKTLNLYGNPALTKAQIDQLQKALPKCRISSNPKK
jgi:Leucine-rich repeat (LRR) protein